MTLRAFIIGLVAVVGFSLADPYLSFIMGYGYLNTSSFPASAVLVLVVLTLGVNAVVGLVRRGWQLKQAELMLVWCMMLCAAAVPAEGIGRYWYSLVAGGPYLARRPDLYWEEDGSLTRVPAELVLSKDPHSVAARQYFEGAGERGRVPWGLWVRPLLYWSAFIVPFFLGIFFLCGILRKQWVDVERLMFPLARVPLEFTEGAGASARFGLPRPFTERAFVFGVLFTFAFRLVRALPLFFGAEGGWALGVPFGDMLADTPLQYADIPNFGLWISAVGFAYLVPADVSLSVWFFFLFSRAELVFAHYWALPRAWGTWSPLMSWQQMGANVVFFVAIFFMARRHLWDVARKALGAAGLDDGDEPISYRLAFWGFLICMGACLGWYGYFGARLWTAALVLLLSLVVFFVYARVVAQGGVYVARFIWIVPDVIHGISGGRAFTAAGAVVTQMKSAVLVRNSASMLAPMAIHALRISSVFEKRRRLLLPALIVAVLVAMPCATYTTLTQAYRMGAANFECRWSALELPQGTFDAADRMIKQPAQSAEPYWGAMVFGGVLTAVMLFMRGRFYWWPIHPIGILSFSSWHAQRLWLPFMLGWMVKVGIMKFSGGRLLRDARYFFIALIMVETFVDGVSAAVRALTGGAAPGF